MNHSIDDYISGKYVSANEIKQPLTVRMQDLHWEEMPKEEGKPQETKPVLYFRGGTKGLVLNKTNATVIANAFGTEPETWHGQRVTLIVEPVSAFGKIVDAIRIRIPQERQRVDTSPTQTMEQPPAPVRVQQTSPPITSEVDEDDIPF